MKKLYILQELIITYENKFWFDIIDSDDIDVIIQYYEVFDEKYLSRTYRIVEVLK